MKHSIKQKIRFGTIFLFCLLLLLGGVGIFHIARLKNDSQLILKDNYESLHYCHELERKLDSGNIAGFERTLQFQEQNVTEKGEAEATARIRELISLYKLNKQDSIEASIRDNIQQVLALNMAAIEAKNNKASRTADLALTYILAIGALIFLVGLSFTYNFPSIVTHPVSKITEGIRQIGQKNYGHRIHLETKDEFGQMAEAFNNMAERLEYFENSNLNKIIFEKTRAEAVINSLRDASIGIDSNGIILFVNKQALQLLALSPEKVIAKNVNEISAVNDLFRHLMEEKSGLPFKIVVDKRENFFIKEVIELSLDDGNGKVIVVKNVTSFKELDVAKTNFLATISHELKTPLASSDLSIKLLENPKTGALNEEQKEFVESLRKDNQRMLKILSELLNMAQIETGKMELNIREVSPYNVVHASIDSLASSAAGKNIRITTFFEKNLPTINADADKTTWVLNNFLSNAIRYSHQNSEVQVTMVQSGKMVRISVKDAGPGIPSEFMPKLFERFFKVPGTGSEGNGLGLSICKEFIEAQNGALHVNSVPGEGSTFSFELPVT